MSYNLETNKYEGYIYLITDLINGGRYVGQTCRTVNERWKQHVHTARLKNVDYISSDIDMAIRTFGEDNFTVEQLEKNVCDTLEELEVLNNEREMYWIKYYNTYHSLYDYNMTPGGDNAHVTTEKTVLIYTINGEFETRIKGMGTAGDYLGVCSGTIWRACQDPKKYRLCNKHIIRYDDDPLTDDDLVNIKTKYPQYYQYDFNGNLLNVFDNHLDDAIAFMKSIGKPCTKINIVHAASESGLSSKGFIWRRYPDKFEDKSLPPKIKQRQVEKRDPYTGELLISYIDLNDASKKEGIFHKTLCGCCTRANGQMITHGFHWCYAGDFDWELFDSYKRQNHMMKKYR